MPEKLYQSIFSFLDYQLIKRQKLSTKWLCIDAKKDNMSLNKDHLELFSLL